MIKSLYVNMMPYRLTHLPLDKTVANLADISNRIFWNENDRITIQVSLKFATRNLIDTVEVKEWISNFIPHFIMDAITYPWRD